MIKNKYVTIFTYLIVMLGVLIGLNYLLAPIKTRNEVKLYTDKYEGFAEDLVLVEVLNVNSPIISEKILATLGGEQVTLYGAREANDFGDIEIMVALDNDGLVRAIKALRVNQSFSIEQLTELIVNMKDQSINVPAGNVTGVTIGSITIQNILTAIKDEHFEGIDQIQILFGRGAKLAELEEVNSNGIINKQEILLEGEVIGTIYDLEKEFIDETGKQVVSYKVYVDNNNSLLYYQLLSYEGDSVELPNVDVNDLLSLIEGGN